MGLYASSSSWGPAWLEHSERQVQRRGDTTTAWLRGRFRASLDRIWAACTNRDQLRCWFADVSGEL